MEDIAAAAGMSRAAVYRYVPSKNEAYRLLAGRLFNEALATARAAAGPGQPLQERLYAALSAKVELTVRLIRDSPHAAELLGAGHLIADLADGFTAALTELVTEILSDSGVDRAGEVAGLLLALARGLEADLDDPDAAYRQLRLGLDLIVAGAGRG